MEHYNPDKREEPEEDNIEAILAQSAQRVKTNLHGQLEQARSEVQKLKGELKSRHHIMHQMNQVIQEA